MAYCNGNIPLIALDFTITKTVVEAKVRKLSSKWTVEEPSEPLPGLEVVWHESTDTYKVFRGDTKEEVFIPTVAPKTKVLTGKNEFRRFDDITIAAWILVEEQLIIWEKADRSQHKALVREYKRRGLVTREEVHTYGIDVEEELLRTMAEEITKDMDKRILDALRPGRQSAYHGLGFCGVRPSCQDDGEAVTRDTGGENSDGERKPVP